jgi:hypothetical protein
MRVSVECWPKNHHGFIIALIQYGCVLTTPDEGKR